jgi:hypothetical protein
MSKRMFGAIGYLVRSEILHRCRQGIQLGILPSFIGSLLNQKYVGDVTIVPPLSISGYARVISNPTTESLTEFVKTGEKRTWPSISLIRSQCELEIVLDQCVRKLAAEAQQQPHPVGKSTSVPTRREPRRHTHLDLNNFFGTASVLHGERGARDSTSTGFREEIVATIIAQDEHEEQRENAEHKNPIDDPSQCDAAMLATSEFVNLIRQCSTHSTAAGDGVGGAD